MNSNLETNRDTNYRCIDEMFRGKKEDDIKVVTTNFQG